MEFRRKKTQTSLKQVKSSKLLGTAHQEGVKAGLTVLLASLWRKGGGDVIFRGFLIVRKYQ